ncbi:RagB/SusD family nutrient uptake outer membrane protein, partial [Prevotella sp.]
MKVNKYIMCLSLASAALAFTSCNDFLDKYPDSRMDLKTPSESSQLLVSAYPQGHPAYLLEMYSDNTDEQLHSTWSAFDRFQEQAYQWKDIDEVSNPETPHQLWEAHYAAISTCNETLDHIDKVKDKEAYDAQKGEALLCRAFAMFQLSTVFCQAYDKTTAQNNLGLPYPKQPERVVGRLMERGTLAELYKNIENDLVEGMKLVGTKYDKPKFHFTKQAAYAFATRFYLYAQQYDKAVEYANKVLGDHPEDILRNWAEWNRLGPSGNVQPYDFIKASKNAN